MDAEGEERLWKGVLPSTTRDSGTPLVTSSFIKEEKYSRDLRMPVSSWDFPWRSSKDSYIVAELLVLISSKEFQES